MEGDAADHAVIDILIIFKVVLVVVEVRHIGSYLESDGARAEGRGIVVFHKAFLSLVIRPAGLGDLRYYLDSNIIVRELRDGYGEVLHLGVGGGRLIRLGSLGLHRIEIFLDGLIAGEAAGVVCADCENARILFREVDIDEVA